MGLASAQYTPKAGTQNTCNWRSLSTLGSKPRLARQRPYSMCGGVRQVNPGSVPKQLILQSPLSLKSRPQPNPAASPFTFLVSDPSPPVPQHTPRLPPRWTSVPTLPQRAWPQASHPGRLGWLVRFLFLCCGHIPLRPNNIWGYPWWLTLKTCSPQRWLHLPIAAMHLRGMSPGLSKRAWTSVPCGSQNKRVGKQVQTGHSSEAGPPPLTQEPDPEKGPCSHLRSTCPTSLPATE